MQMPSVVNRVGSVVGKVVQVAVVPVAAGVVFTPAVGVAFAVGRECGWIGGKAAAEQPVVKTEAVSVVKTEEVPVPVKETVAA